RWLPTFRRRESEFDAGVFKNKIRCSKLLQPETSLAASVAQLIVRGQYHQYFHCLLQLCERTQRSRFSGLSPLPCHPCRSLPIGSVDSNAAAVSHSRVCASNLSHLRTSIDSLTAALSAVRPPTALLQAPVRNWLF